MKLYELNNFLYETFKDYLLLEDYLKNGLEIEGEEEINKVLFSVSFNKNVAEYAIKNTFDAIITHHGIFGRSFIDFTGNYTKKIRDILKNNISLFSFHLPLDKHRTIGNNASLASTLNFEIIDEIDAGYICLNNNKLNIKEICSKIYDEIDKKIKLTLIKKCDFLINKNINHYMFSGFNVLLNNDDIPKKIAIISGGVSENSIKSAIINKCDLFITGELKLHISDLCFETGLNYIALGHYYSEIFGVLNLKDLIENKFNLNCEFLNDENLL